MASEKHNKGIVTDWLEEDNLMLLECWARDGYTMSDIATRIGITLNTLTAWKERYPEIGKAISKGKEIIDYKVENALLKSALGYKTKEVKVTTTMRYGKVVEVVKEVTDKEQAPNVSAIQCWLYNRLPDKWKKNRDNLIELDEEDTKIHVTVTRASRPTEDQSEDQWQSEMNESIEIRRSTEEEIEEAKKSKRNAAQSAQTKVEIEENDDIDYWPEDWEEDDD